MKKEEKLERAYELISARVGLKMHYEIENRDDSIYLTDKSSAEMLYGRDLLMIADIVRLFELQFYIEREIRGPRNTIVIYVD